MYRGKNIQSIDEFIATFPSDIQKILQGLRQKIIEVAPEAKQKISYGIPTFTMNGKNLVHFSAYKTHIGFYPGSGPIEEFKRDLEPYETSKGTVRFPLDKALPYELIQKIVKAAAKAKQMN